MPVVVLREKERQNRYISVVSRPSKRISKYHKLLLLLLRACHPNERASVRTNDPPSVCVQPFVSPFAFAILNGERKTFFRCLKRVRHFRPQFSCAPRSFKRAKRATRMTTRGLSLSALGRVRLRDARTIERRLFRRRRYLSRAKDDGKRERERTIANTTD